MAGLRLIAARGLSNGAYDAGIAIDMSPGSHTYWKQPGDAGVPPVFDFNGSENVAKAEVRYPVPARISDQGLEAFGYAHRVVFPVVVTPIDPAKPAVLKADVTYAICNTICIPEHGGATLELRPSGPDIDGGEVRAALAAVPAAASASDRESLSVVPNAAPRSWTLTWSGTPAVDDIFAAAPEGFYFATKKIGPNRFSLKSDEPAGLAKVNHVPVEFTLVCANRGLVETRTLDVSGPSR
jgi:DsbC/DsbD-like thiol-disulfide interchange protein